jgi:hypothetical protein
METPNTVVVLDMGQLAVVVVLALVGVHRQGQEAMEQPLRVKLVLLHHLVVVMAEVEEIMVSLVLLVLLQEEAVEVLVVAVEW